MSDTDCCHACAKDIEGDFITCQGFCNGNYHAECCGVNVDFLLQVINHRQMFWLCKSCAGLMRNMRVRRSVKSAYQVGQENMLGDHKQLVEQLKREIITDVKAELQLNFAKLVNSSSLTPMSSNIPRNARGRRLFDNKSQRPMTNNKTPTPLATGHAASPSLGNFIAPQKPHKFWLYLSRAARTVTVEQVTKLAMKRLGTTDVEVYSLVAKGKDINRMNFISFKIGMDMKLKEKALSLSTWPAGLLVREFEKRSNAVENVWEPPIRESPAAQNEEQMATHAIPDTHRTPSPMATL